MTLKIPLFRFLLAKMIISNPKSCTIYIISSIKENNHEKGNNFTFSGFIDICK